MERWSPNGELIVAGTDDGRVAVRRAVSGLLLWTSLAHQDHHGAIRVIAWSPDGCFIASGSDDQMIKIWDSETGSIVYTYTGHTTPVLALEWSPTGHRIVSAGMGDPQVWDVPQHCEEMLVS